MTRTTAKKGMVEFKIGYAKDDFDFGYLSAINYDDNRKLVQVIEALFGKLEKLDGEIERVKQERDQFMVGYDVLKQEHDKLIQDLKALKVTTLD